MRPVLRLGLYGPRASALLASIAALAVEAGHRPVQRTNRVPLTGPTDVEPFDLVLVEDGPAAEGIVRAYARHKPTTRAYIIDEDTVPAELADLFGLAAPTTKPHHGDDSTAEIVMDTEVDASALEALTVAELKAKLEQAGIAIEKGWKKPDLIAALIAGAIAGADSPPVGS